MSKNIVLLIFLRLQFAVITAFVQTKAQSSDFDEQASTLLPPINTQLTSYSFVNTLLDHSSSI
jgi:hypothetical protein